MQCWASQAGVQPSQRNYFLCGRKETEQAGSATYEHILVGLAGMSKSVLDFVISIQSWSDLEGNQVELVSQKKEFLFWGQFRLLVVNE